MLVTELVLTEGMTLAEVRVQVAPYIQNPFSFLFDGEPLPVEDEEGFEASAIKVDCAIHLKDSGEAESIQEPPPQAAPPKNKASE